MRPPSRSRRRISPSRHLSRRPSDSGARCSRARSAAFATEDFVEGAAVLAVAVADQEPDAPFGEVEAEVTRLLCDRAAPGQQDIASAGPLAAENLKLVPHTTNSAALSVATGTMSGDD
jgi:hypothetical protein